MDEAYVFEGGLSVVAGVESRESVQKARYVAATALLVVDVQKDFADPTGALAVPGGAGVVPIANREMSAALQSGATVVLTQDWHPAVTPHFLTGGGRWPVHCVGGTRGAELHPDLEVPEERASPFRSPPTAGPCSARGVGVVLCASGAPRDGRAES